MKQMLFIYNINGGTLEELVLDKFLTSGYKVIAATPIISNRGVGYQSTTEIHYILEGPSE